MNECYRILVSRLDIGEIEKFKNAAKKITIEKDDNIYKIIFTMIRCDNFNLKLNELFILPTQACVISDFHRKIRKILL